MTITSLPTTPARTMSQTAFDSAMAAFLAALPTFVTETNALAAALNSIAAGTAVAIPYTFSTTTTDADPGAGYLRLDNATQNLATTIRADLVGADGSTWTDVLATFDDSTSTVKGHIMLQKLADATKWILFSVSALASPSGYKNITVAVVAASAASPFANNDSIILKFTRTGDKGADGTGGLVPLATIPASGAGSVDIETVAAFDGTYRSIVVIATNVTTSVDNTSLQSRVKIGGAYLTSGYQGHITTLSSGDPTYLATANAAASITIAEEFGNAAGESGRFVIEINRPDSTTLQKLIEGRGTYIRGSGAVRGGRFHGANTNTGAMQGLRIYPASGTISGTFDVFGIPNPT